MGIGTNYEGMSEVTVNKEELLDILYRNRDAHRDVFLKAQHRYRELVIQELDAMLRDAREGKAIRRAVSLVEPQEHTRDYNRVIRMLEMSVAQEIKISEREFSSYVLDEWGWSQQFTTTNASYVVDP